MKKMRSIELFAGCGGLALGMAEAGFDHSLVVEYDPHACATLEFNKKRRVRHFADWNIQQEDVRNIDFSSWAGKIDVISGGPPCQPFSIGGKHKGPADKRNMWPEAIRAVREIRPKGFIFENVRGLLRPNFADYLKFIQLQLAWPTVRSRGSKTWRDALKKLDQHARSGARPEYRVIVRAINPADYGASQKRHRAIFMGVRSDIAEEIIFPAATHSVEALVWDQAISGAYWNRHELTRPNRRLATISEERTLKKIREGGERPSGVAWKTVRDTIGDLPKPTPQSEYHLNHLLHKGAKAYVGHTGSFWDEPAKALKAGAHGVPGGENILVGPNGKVRYFTVREMARLQGLPDSFGIDESNESWQSAIKQLGNAVPVEVGRVFGGSIMRQIAQR